MQTTDCVCVTFVTDDLRTKGAKPPAEEREKRPEPNDPGTRPAVDR